MIAADRLTASPHSPSEQGSTDLPSQPAHSDATGSSYPLGGNGQPARDQAHSDRLAAAMADTAQLAAALTLTAQRDHDRHDHGTATTAQP